MIVSIVNFPGNTEAELISRGPNLKQVGPINESNGFPLWYKDSNNVKLELCLDPKDQYCGLVPEGPDDFDANKPIIFPDNYPGEAFYQLAETEMRVLLETEKEHVHFSHLKLHLTWRYRKSVTKLYLGVSALELRD